MKELTEAQIVELRVQVVKRLVELFEENEYLKRELRARRRQADVWRKRCSAKTKELEDLIGTGRKR